MFQCVYADYRTSHRHQASKKGTTIADLHNTWATGTSALEAILSWKSLNYIGVVTIFVATLPANGILLQNAVHVVVEDTSSIHKNLLFNIASKPPADWYSATLNPKDLTVSAYNNKWNLILPQVDLDPVVFVNTLSNLTTCHETCFANLSSIGFEATCSQSTLPYSLPFDNNVTSETPDATLFSVDFTWNVTDPYTIGMDTLFKNDSSCSGLYQISNCTLKLGTVLLPAIVQYNVSGLQTGNQTTNTWFLDYDNWMDLYNINADVENPYKNVPSNLFTPYPPPKISEARTGNTTFGGIAAAAQQFFDSTIVWHPVSEGVDIVVSGEYARQIAPIYGG
jgi:hypothetical protein